MYDWLQSGHLKSTSSNRICHHCEAQWIPQNRYFKTLFLLETTIRYYLGQYLPTCQATGTHFPFMSLIGKVPFADWTKPENHRRFFDDLMQQLQLKSLDGFYKISSKDINHYGGQPLLEELYGGSITKALQSVYPNHSWFPWKFEGNLPRGFWDQ